MDNNVVRLNNFKENKEYKIKYFISRTDVDNGFWIDPEVNKELILLDEISNNLYILEYIQFEHIKFKYVLVIYTHNNGHSRVSMFKEHILSHKQTLLIHELEYNDIMYVNNLKEVIGDEFKFKNIFGKDYVFMDYSKAPFQYNADSYISIDNDEKDKMWYNDQEKKESYQIIDDDIFYLRTKNVVEEHYDIANYNILLLGRFYPYDNQKIIALYNRDNIESSVHIIVNDNIIRQADGLTDSKDLSIDKYKIETISGNHYKILLDFDWIPNTIEYKDGYGNLYEIQKMNN